MVVAAPIRLPVLFCAFPTKKMLPSLHNGGDIGTTKLKINNYLNVHLDPVLVDGDDLQQNKKGLFESNNKFIRENWRKTYV